MSSITPIRILLIEDSDTDTFLIRAALEEGLQTPFAIESVKSLMAGLTRLDQWGIDLVLVDLSLPDSSGIDTFSQVHARAGGIPVVVLTGVADQELAVNAVRLGAHDYVVKSAISEGFLPYVVRLAIERSVRFNTEKELRATQNELAAARKIQQRLLSQEPPQLAGFDIACGCEPATATGGDFYDFIPMPDGRTGIVIGDVCGHGCAAALIMVGTRCILRTLAKWYDDVGKLLTAANLAIVEDSDEGQFVSLVFARLHPDSRTLEYAGAGHDAFLFEPSGEFRKLKSTGLVLGLLADAMILTGEPLVLQPGQLLVLLTDGVCEAQSPDGRLLGSQAVFEIIRSHLDRPCRDIVEALMAAARDHTHPNALQDDATIVLLKAL